MESLPTIIVALLVLSMITEKITDYLKTIPQLGLCKQPEADDATERKRLRRLLIVTILTGISVALVSKADIFQLVNSQIKDHAELPGDVIGWQNYKIDWGIAMTILGCILCGLFLSLGSKFWHDMLDIILAVKNLKRKLSDEETFKMDSTKDLDAWLAVREGDMVKKVLDDNKEKLMKIPNVIGVGAGINKAKERCIKIYATEAIPNADISTLFYEVPGGQLKKIPVEVVVTDEPTTQAFLPGTEIQNQYPIYGQGTFGCVVRDIFTQEKYALTCYHAVISGHQWGRFSPKNKEVVLGIENGKKSIMGNLVYGMVNSQIDIALIKPENQNILDNIIEGIGRIKGARPFSEDDVLGSTNVKVKGKNHTTAREGVVIDQLRKIKLKYPDGVRRELENLIVLSMIEDSERVAMTTPGDSGAVVLDSKNRVIGMIVGGDSKFSYAIPIQTICENASIEIVNS